jgi:tripartite-type tricarboxylate transporter receptor subunit TctC
VRQVHGGPDDRKGALEPALCQPLPSVPATRKVVSLFFTLAAVVFSGSAVQAADAYPSKPIRMIVAVPPGGPADTLARIVAPRLTEALGQTVVIDNRPGANGNIAYEMAARAAPDGYTIVLVAAGVAINPSLYRDVRYDPVADFSPISLGVSVPNILVVHPSVAATSVKELAALVRAKPGQLAFASAGSGTSGHLALELFKSAARIDIIHVPYKGGGPALNDLIGGQVQALFSLALAAVPQVKGGRARALAITSAKRSAVAPELPTIAESGFPGFEVIGWFGWLAPAKMPRAIVERLNREIVSTLERADTRDRLLGLGADPAPTTPAQFGAFVRSEHAKWGKVIKQSGISVE